MDAYARAIKIINLALTCDGMKFDDPCLGKNCIDCMKERVDMLVAEIERGEKK